MTIDETLEDSVKLTLLATGLKGKDLLGSVGNSVAGRVKGLFSRS